ncbi:5'-AMP-activated protein kinase subunit beta-1 isoform X1 [Globicephala melas]|nr:5'-AMP-activated protein kinase subunit beta-1 isoform X1 [Globicephala melas]
MGNTSSERAALDRQGGHKTPRGDSSGGSKDGDRPKILMDSPEDADLFHSEEIKAPEKEEFLAWQHDLEVNDKAPAQARPTVFRWTGGGKEVYLSGSFNNWSKLPLTRSHNNFVAILDLPEGEHQYKFFVDGQWTHDPSEPIVTSQLGTVNNIIQVKKTDFEVFDALMVDSQKCSDVSELSSSPPGPYHQEPYVWKPEERFKAPPILPPHLLQVILNKDTGISCDPALLPEPNHVMLNHLYALSIKVSIKLCKDNRRALGGRFDFVQSFGEETGALPELYSVQCFSVFFPPWHTLKMVPSLWHSGVSGRGSSAPSRAEGLSLTHLFRTQIRRPLRGCKIEPRGTARPQGKPRKSSSEGPWLAQVGSIPAPRSCCFLLIDKHHRGAWDYDALLEDTRMFWSQLFSPAKRASVPSTKKMEGYSVPLVISLFFPGIRKRK